jgi:hypothetical protein
MTSSEEKSALVRVSIRQQSKEIKSQQAAARKSLRAEAKERRHIIAGDRKECTRNYRRDMRELKNLTKQVSVECAEAISQSDDAILAAFTAVAQNKADAGVLAVNVAHVDKQAA